MSIKITYGSLLQSQLEMDCESHEFNDHNSMYSFMDDRLDWDDKPVYLYWCMNIDIESGFFPTIHVGVDIGALLLFLKSEKRYWNFYVYEFKNHKETSEYIDLLFEGIERAI